MKVLFLGGTRFIGLTLARRALELGHDVTLFHRGTTKNSLPGAREVFGDREKDLSLLSGDSFDLVLDSSAYFPASVEKSAYHFKENLGSYVFISTTSVYDYGASTPPTDESSKLAEVDGTEEATSITPENYGALKVVCERTLEKAFGDRLFVARPGIQIGPGDHTGRLSYWLHAAKKAGEIHENLIAPKTASWGIQPLDVRDFADGIWKAIEGGANGIMNFSGTPISMKNFLRTCLQATKSKASIQWSSEKELFSKFHTTPIEFPYWNGGIEEAVVSRKAEEIGLRRRPLLQTILDCLSDQSTDRFSELMKKVAS